MLRIGETAKQYNISKRTLRYWEEMGILTSTRAENDYRFYDAESVACIRQIVLLRKLRVPITDIERIFLENNPDVAIVALTCHLENLKSEAANSDTLARLVEIVIEYIRQTRNLSQFFVLLENQPADLDKDISALQNTLSERIFTLSEQKLTNVRIIRLPAMMVASYRAESASPEGDCGKVMIPFVTDNNLHKCEGFRFFGFHPKDGVNDEEKRSYSYEQWVTIQAGFDVPEPFVKKQFEGGLFASAVTQMNVYRETWHSLKMWSEGNGKYEVDDHNHILSRQWTEEFIDFETFALDENMPFGEKQLDLLMPIRLK